MTERTFADYGIAGIDLSPHAPNVQRTTCPKCSAERKKSNVKCLTVWTKEGTFSCTHCGYGKGLRIGKRRGNFPEFRAMDNGIIEKTTTNLPKAAVTTVRQWLANRGIDWSLAESVGVMPAVQFFPQSEQKKIAIAFPYTWQGEVINIKYRSLDKEFVKVKDADIPMYNLDAVGDCDYVIITEGEMDALAFMQAGFPSVVSMPDGAPAKNTVNLVRKMKPLEDSQAVFQHCSKVYVATDKDDAGRRLAEEIIVRLGRERCYLINFPQGCKDANDVLMQRGAEALKYAVDLAKPAPLDGQHYVSELGDDALMKEAIQKPPVGASTGWQKFDKLLSFHRGQFTVVTGVPLSGKSTFVDNIMVNTALKSNWKWAVFSPEHDFMYHVQRLSEIYVGAPFLRSSVGSMSYDDVEAARLFIDEHFLWIGDDETEATVSNILRLAEDAVVRHGCDGVVLDPWNYIVQTKDARTNETDHIGAVLREFVRFARKTNCHLILVAHPRKVDRLASGDYEDISLYSISGSANFFNMVQNGVVLMRKGLLTLPPEQQTTIVRVDKVKYKYAGKTGQVEMWYDAFASRFVEDRYSVSRQLSNYEFPQERTDSTGAPF